MPVVSARVRNSSFRRVPDSAQISEAADHFSQYAGPIQPTPMPTYAFHAVFLTSTSGRSKPSILSRTQHFQRRIDVRPSNILCLIFHCPIGSLRIEKPVLFPCAFPMLVSRGPRWASAMLLPSLLNADAIARLGQCLPDRTPERLIVHTGHMASLLPWPCTKQW